MYGKNSTWVTRNATAPGIACNNATFGDPLYGTFKECRIVGASAGTPGNIAPPNAPTANVTGPTGSNVAQVKQPYPGPQRAAEIINDRQANQDKRIAAGKAAGQINPQEEALLNQIVEFINKAERQANKGNQSARAKGAVKAPGSGNIDAAEFDKIMGMLDQLSDIIIISREAEAVAVRTPNAPTATVAGPTGSNVAQVNQPFPGPQRAAEIINDRQANQDKRIAAGKAAGQINPQEEAKLNQIVEFINYAERQANKGNQSARAKGAVKAPGSGNIDAAEFDNIMGMLDYLSDRIKISREAEAVAVRTPNAPTAPVVR
jgi:lactam utilization protein B